ncbi:acyltransferase domain-containing protein [Paenibacillus alba]|uniref:acyltransferase domain-containing protein n=1 Tax=Paenibacillus alba TaxID=1197127 RepID=UPI0015641838|nr:acyltransferase domain-containing protein [Paenibacillus alba]NQX71852.1 acyltransferase domain-containing protein [Paenibacillus alba]
MNNQKIVFMCAGQGSQYYEMGRELFKSSSEFQDTMIKLDKVFFDITKESMIEVLYRKEIRKNNNFDTIKYTHPAIFMVEYSLAQLLINNGIYPEYVVGSSLGEFVSCAIANVMNYEEALHCIMNQANVLERYCKEGGMISIIYDYNLFFNEPILFENSEIACINYQTNFVVSGLIHNLELIEAFLKKRGITFVRLPVKYAFHSSFIDSASESYIISLDNIIYKKPAIKLISSLTGAAITTMNKTYFWDIVRKPINFGEALKTIGHAKDFLYIDLSPSGTLANFAKRNMERDYAEQVFTIMSPFHKDMENVEKLKNLLKPRTQIHIHKHIHEHTNLYTNMRYLELKRVFPEIRKLNEVEEGCPIFWIHGGLGGVGAYSGIAAQMKRPFFGIQARGFMINHSPLIGIQNMSAYYVQIIKAVQPKGPYDLGGFSLGGVLAYEVARQLQKLGEEVNTIVLLDSPFGYINQGDGLQRKQVNPKTYILQAINLAILASLKPDQFNVSQSLIHRNEIDLQLTEDEYIEKVIHFAKFRGLNKPDNFVNALIRSNIKLRPTYRREEYHVHPLTNMTRCYYFNNINNVFLGELESYFMAEQVHTYDDQMNALNQWENIIPNLRVIDVEASNHMMMLSETRSIEAIIKKCGKIYG